MNFELVPSQEEEAAREGEEAQRAGARGGEARGGGAKKRDTPQYANV